MPMPSPMRVPSAASSNGRICPLFDRAWVLLKHMYPKIEFSVSAPPAIIISARPSTSSATAIRRADSDAAQAASTVQFIPPSPRRLATRPETTLASRPGKEFSSHGANAWTYLAAMASASDALSPQLRTTSFRTGVDSRAASGCISGTGPVTPRTTPVRVASYQSDSVAPASRSRSRATIRLSVCMTLVTSSWFGGMPNSNGSKSTSGMKPPRRE